MTTSRRSFLGFLASLPAAVGLVKGASAAEPKRASGGSDGIRAHKKLTVVEDACVYNMPGFDTVAWVENRYGRAWVHVENERTGEYKVREVLHPCTGVTVSASGTVVTRHPHGASFGYFA